MMKRLSRVVKKSQMRNDNEQSEFMDPELCGQISSEGSWSSPQWLGLRALSAALFNLHFNR
jgi:hypothetical protein